MTKTIYIILIIAIVFGVGAYAWSKLGPKDETADWRTYTNTRFGYSIKYPPELTPHTPQNTAAREIINFSGDKAGWIDINVSWDWKSETITTVEQMNELISNPNKVIEPYILDGTKSFRVSFDNSFGGRTIGISTEKNGNLYEIFCSTCNTQELLNRFNKILSTFKFLD